MGRDGPYSELTRRNVLEKTAKAAAGAGALTLGGTAGASDVYCINTESDSPGVYDDGCEFIGSVDSWSCGWVYLNNRICCNCWETDMYFVRWQDDDNPDGYVHEDYFSISDCC